MTERYKTFTVLVNRISRSIRRIKNREMAQEGLRSAHVSCLHYLYLSGALTATELCESCEEDKATVSRALEHLEREGYICCESRAAKRYRSPLLLTDKGRAAGEKIAGKIAQVLDAVSAGLSDAEREAFYRSLAIISDSLERISGQSLDEQLKGEA